MTKVVSFVTRYRARFALKALVPLGILLAVVWAVAPTSMGMQGLHFAFGLFVLAAAALLAVAVYSEARSSELEVTYGGRSILFAGLPPAEGFSVRPPGESWELRHIGNGIELRSNGLREAWTELPPTPRAAALLVSPRFPGGQAGILLRRGWRSRELPERLPAWLRRGVGSLQQQRLWPIVSAALIVMALAVGFGLQDPHSLLSDERLEAYRQRGFTVAAPPGAVDVTLTRPGFSEGKVELARAMASPLMRWQVALAVLAFASVAGIVVFLSSRFGAVVRDRTLIPAAALLSVIGLTMLERLAPDIPRFYPARFPAVFVWPTRQLVMVLVGLVGLVVTIAAMHLLERWEWERRFLRRRLAGLGLYLLVGVAAGAGFWATGVFGHEQYGARLSLQVAGRDLQVVELAKLLLVVFVAAHLSALEAARSDDLSRRLRRAYYGVALFAAAGAATTGDFGVLLLCAGLLAVGPLVGDGDAQPVLVAGAVAVLGVVIVLVLGMPSHAHQRLISWLNPFAASETMALSHWALAAGGLFGTGLGNGLPFSIPNADSDFIFSAVAEELGLVTGAVVLLVLFWLLVTRGFQVATMEEEPFRKHLASMIAVLWALQVVVIVGGTTGLLPLTGLPLPFVARGGMATIANLLSLGIVVQIAFVYRSSRTQTYEGRWERANRRLRLARRAAGTLFACCGIWVGLHMTWLGPSTSVAHFEDAQLLAGYEALVEGRMLRARDGKSVLDRSRLEEVLADVSRAQRRTLTAAVRHFSTYPRAVGVEGETLVVDAAALRRSDPRRAARLPVDVVDRGGRLLATTSSSGRHYPYDWVAFPFLGFSRFGEGTFLEGDLKDLVVKLEGRPATWRRLVGSLQLRFRGREKAIAERGRRVELTIDIDVQRVAMDELRLACRDGRTTGGAAAAIDLETGELLALASWPSFSPELRRDEPSWDRDFTDEALDLRRNRMLHRFYPPGSVFKIITATALAEAGKSDFTTRCSGSDGDLRVRDYQVAAGSTDFAHGRIGFRRAFSQSCNVYFARAGLQLGPLLGQLAERFGLHERIDLLPGGGGSALSSLPSHVMTCYSLSGIGGLPRHCDGKTSPLTPWPVPDAYYASNPLVVARVAFGQTAVVTTPMHLLVATATIALRGDRPEPALVRSVSKGGVILYSHRPSLRRSVVPSEAAALVAEAMVATAETGTGSRSVIPERLVVQGGHVRAKRPDGRGTEIPFAAKTGTAEVEGAEPHAWFVAFAPVERPRVAVVLLLEHGRSGGYAAGPPALRLLAAALDSRAE